MITVGLLSDDQVMVIYEKLWHGSVVDSAIMRLSAPEARKLLATLTVLFGRPTAEEIEAVG